MSGINLFVLKNSHVAFSDYHVRNNKMLMKLPLIEMIEIKEPTLKIFLDTQSLILNNTPANGYGDHVINTSGPLAIKINSQGDVAELTKVNGQLEIMSFRGRWSNGDLPLIRRVEEHFYVRSSSWSLESAANAGCYIYEDVGTIFEEAYYSCGLTPPPYYVVDIKDITNALLNSYLIMQVVLMTEKDPTFDFNAKENKGREYDRYKDLNLFNEDLDFLQKNTKCDSQIKSLIFDLMKLERRNAIFSSSVEQSSVTPPEKIEVKSSKNKKSVKKK